MNISAVVNYLMVKPEYDVVLKSDIQLHLMNKSLFLVINISVFPNQRRKDKNNS